MTLRYALASTLANGLTHDFAAGPRNAPEREWMSRAGLVFQIEDGETPSVAFEAVTPLASSMGKEMFALLSDIDLSFEMAVARGEDAVDDFQARWDALRALLDAAPWTFDPDAGLVSAPAPGHPGSISETKVAAVRYSADVYRLIRGQDIVGFASALTNGRWVMCDPNDRRMSADTFATPADVAAAFPTISGAS